MKDCDNERYKDKFVCEYHWKRRHYQEYTYKRKGEKK